MALPVQLTNTGNPVVDATQLMTNYNWLDTGKYRQGVVASITFASDGSATATVTYSTPFANATDVVSGIVLANYSGSDNGFLSYRISSITASGFTLILGGGSSGSTVDAHFSAIGH